MSLISEFDSAIAVKATVIVSFKFSTIELQHVNYKVFHIYNIYYFRSSRCNLNMKTLKKMKNYLPNA